MIEFESSIDLLAYFESNKKPYNFTRDPDYDFTHEGDAWGGICEYIYSSCIFKKLIIFRYTVGIGGEKSKVTKIMILKENHTGFDLQANETGVMEIKVFDIGCNKYAVMVYDENILTGHQVRKCYIVPKNKKWKEVKRESVSKT
jgi:hypothetical protein